jgi:hypothetical protein
MSDYDLEDDLDSIRDYIEDMREMGMDSLEVDMLSKRFPMVENMTTFVERLGFSVADDLVILNY